jgi:hypothetical protein
LGHRDDQIVRIFLSCPVLSADRERVRTRPLVCVQLTVLGLGLVVAGLQGGSGTPMTATAVASYVPPMAVAAAPVPSREVHTFAGKVTARPKAAARRTPPSRTTAKPGRSAVRPRATASRPTSTVKSTVVRGTPTVTFQQALDAAIARIPTYRAGAARWVVSRAYDFWGTADWYHDVLYVSPDVPRAKLYDVAVHEWSHELSALDYGGDVAAATKAMNAWFGGSNLTGPERAADCMAILQGARWTHYTTCANPQWRAGAARLIAGKQL